MNQNRLELFPIMMFTIIMGLSGLTLSFKTAHDVLGISIIFSEILVYIVSIVFITILSLYTLKIIKYLDQVKNEFNHPVKINFFATSSISFLLISTVYHDINSTIALYSFYVGVVMQTFFTFYTISFWINNNLEIQHSNPAWFIPIVGNLLVPISSDGFIDNNFLMYYFSVGMFFWIILTSILINRIIFHHQMAMHFIPTLFIFIAPPSVGMIGYVKMYGSFDMFASTLFNLALFFSFLLFFMYKNFIKLKFFISWWAFTFPLATVSIASMVAYKKTDILAYSYLSYFFVFLTSLVVFVVIFKTIKHIINKDICVQG